MSMIESTGPVVVRAEEAERLGFGDAAMRLLVDDYFADSEVWRESRSVPHDSKTH